MNQKLTLSVEEKAIDIGKSYAKANGESLSSIVESFLFNLEPTFSADESLVPISNKLYSLLGISSGQYSEADYKDHLAEKFGSPSK